MCFGLLAGFCNAENIPIIQGTVPNYSGETFVVLFEDDGDGGYNSAQESVSQVYSSEDGAYEFGSLSADLNYFVGVNGQISSLITPGAVVESIDEFDVFSESEASPSDPHVTTHLLDTDILGGTRRLTTTLDNGIGNVELTVNNSGSSIRFASGPGAAGTAYVTWDGAADNAQPNPALMLGGIDLTFGGQLDAFTVRAGFDASSAGAELAFRIFNSDEDNYSETTLAVPINGGSATEFLTFRFSDLAGPVSANDVDAIQLVLQNAPGSADGQLAAAGFIQTIIEPEFSTPVLGVPEPVATNSFAMLILGVSVLGRNPRRTKTISLR